MSAALLTLIEEKDREIAQLRKDCRQITAFADEALKEIIDHCGMCGVKDPLPCISHKRKFGGYSDALADPYRPQAAINTPSADLRREL